MSSHALGFGDGFSVNAYTNHPPAIIRKAIVKNNSYYVSELRAMDGRHDKERFSLMEEWRLSGTWREKHKTWDDACREEAEMSSQAFYKGRSRYNQSQTILPTKVGEIVGHSCDKDHQDNNKQLNVKPRPPVPAVDISANAKSEPEPAIVDKVGRTIPPYALDYWRRSSEVQHVLSALSDLRTTIRKANESGDRLWCAFDTQDLLLSFDALYTSVSNFMPYAVCKKCNGVETKTLCSMCHGTGLINKTTYGFNKS